MSITVLLADDHAVVRDGLQALLQAQRDIEVVGHAANGRDAIRETARLSPDVAIVDIAMPELNGIEVTRQIGEVCPATEVIILSMYSTSEDVYRALQAGARGYVLKESAGSEVVEAIRVVHLGFRYLSRKIEGTVVDEYLRQREALRPAGPLASLTLRERQVLELVVEGRTSAEIGETLFLSPRTIEVYRRNLKKKLGIADLPGLVKFAIQHGLVRLR